VRVPQGHPPRRRPRSFAFDSNAAVLINPQMERRSAPASSARCRRELRAKNHMKIIFACAGGALMDVRPKNSAPRRFGLVQRELRVVNNHMKIISLAAGGAVMAAKIPENGDNVVVICGAATRAAAARVIEVRRSEERALCACAASTWSSGHQKQSASQEGRHRRQGILRPPVEPRAPADPKDGKPTRVGFKVVGDKKVPLCQAVGS